jgi:hypothetical protein
MMLQLLSQLTKILTATVLISFSVLGKNYICEESRLIKNYTIII